MLWSFKKRGRIDLASKERRDIFRRFAFSFFGSSNFGPKSRISSPRSLFSTSKKFSPFCLVLGHWCWWCSRFIIIFLFVKFYFSTSSLLSKKSSSSSSSSSVSHPTSLPPWVGCIKTKRRAPSVSVSLSLSVLARNTRERVTSGNRA